MIFVSVALILSVAVAQSCQGTFKNVPYDLSPLTKSNGDYVTNITSSDGLTLIKLVYNICRNTVTVPKDWDGADTCKTTQHKVEGGKVVETSDPSPAFLITKPNGKQSTCSRVGLDFTKAGNSKLELYDTTDPAMGVILTYLEGDFCCPKGTSCSDTEYEQQTIAFSFRCTDGVSNIPEVTNMELNKNGCTHKIFYRSIYACPTICPTKDNNVCGKHGICGFDAVAKEARCYCTSNYQGTSCDTYVNTQLKDYNMWAIVLTIVLTAGVIFTIGYVWNKLRKINVNPDAFDHLENQFNELGQMTY